MSYKRRAFIKNTAAAATAMWLSSFEVFADGNKFAMPSQNKFALKILVTKWEEAVKAYFSCWDKIVEQKKQEGELLTVLTEFGPPDYMPAMAYTRQPLADQWAINVYMMQLLRKRYL